MISHILTFGRKKELKTNNNKPIHMWCKDKVIWFWTKVCTKYATGKETTPENTVHNGYQCT